MTKMTYVAALNSAIACESLSAEVVEKLTALKASLEKKASTEKKPTKTQVANEATKELILTVLQACAEPLTISELQTKHEEFAEMSNQKLAALVRLLVNEKKVERVEEKRKAYFRAV